MHSPKSSWRLDADCALQLKPATHWRGRHRSRRCALAHQNPCAAHSSGMQNRAYQSVATPLTKSQRFPTCGTAATRPHALHLLDERLSPGCTFGDGCTTRCYKRHPCNSSAGLVLLICQQQGALADRTICGLHGIGRYGHAAHAGRWRCNTVLVRT